MKEKVIFITPCPYIILDSNRPDLVIVSFEDLVKVQKKINRLEKKVRQNKADN